MSLRRKLVFVLVGVLPSMAASYRTTNFYVEAPTPQIAQQIGVYAENYRRQKALEWLGQEMPNWPEPCPIKVKVTRGPAGGYTSFNFDWGRAVLRQEMNIEGSLDRLLASVLPHEVTHTVFAYYFRMPVPRWADEGGAVLSEDEYEKNDHDLRCRQILNTPGRGIPLRRLFALREYPGDMMALYAEGFSISDYLVRTRGKPAFLAFVAHGMNYGWDNAVQTYYRYNSVEELEQAWLTHLRNTRRQPTFLAQNTRGTNATPGLPTGGTPALPTAAARPYPSLPEPVNPQALALGQRPAPAGSRGEAKAGQGGSILTRQTAPPVQPQLSAPVAVFRGRSPEGERWDDPLRDAATPDGASVRPGYLPDYVPSSAIQAMTGSGDGWHPVIGPPQFNSTPVKLGPPQTVVPAK
jgi:hypothetical protein